MLSLDLAQLREGNYPESSLTLQFFFFLEHHVNFFFLNGTLRNKKIKNELVM